MNNHTFGNWIFDEENNLYDDGNDAIGFLIMDEQNWKMMGMMDGNSDHH